MSTEKVEPAPKPEPDTRAKELSFDVWAPPADARAGSAPGSQPDADPAIRSQAA